MPDSTIDIVEPDVRGELDGLRLLVEETDGNVIAFVRYRRVTEREAGVRYLKDQLRVPVEERVLTGERQNPLALLENLPDERRCVQLYDLEAALPEVTGYLNVNREAYAEVPHALVFWVGEHGLREVATNAPDFWAWRSGVFDVRSEDPDLSQFVSQVALADDVRFTDRGDLERRAQLYDGLIQEYEGEDEAYVVQLRLKLSTISLMLRDLERAEKEAREALMFSELTAEEEIAAHAYYNLGMVALERRELEKAEEWYRKSLEIEERLGNKRLAAMAYNGLGRVALELQKLDEADQWYQRSAEIFERLDEQQGQATTYHQLGVVAHERGELEEAEQWYRKSAEISKRQGNEHGMAKTYHQLGIIAQEGRELAKAEQWHRKSAEIKKRLGNKHGLAKSYHELGRLAQERGELEEAEQWYHKATALIECSGDDHSAALTYGQRGRLARKRGNLQDAGRWFLQAIRRFLSTNDPKSVHQAFADFARTYGDVPPDVQEDLRQQWIDAGLPEDDLDDLLEQIQRGD